MIASLLRNFLIALVLHAGAALAFDRDDTAPVVVATAHQACLLPIDSVAAQPTLTSLHKDTGARS